MRKNTVLSWSAAAAAGFLLCALGSCHGSGGDPGHHDKSPEAIMRANCGTCHGVNGEGGFSWVESWWPAPAIAGYPPGFLRSTVRSGRPAVMPAIPEQEITDAELDALAHYIEGLPAGAAPEPAFDVTVTITDEDPWFNPPQVSIGFGQRVRFVNAGRTYHPVVDVNHLTSGGRQGTHSGNIGPGGVHFVDFPASGVYTFLCGMHPYMRGEVHVGGSFTPPVYSVHVPAPLPAVPGTGEIWVLCQFQDWPGRAQDGVVQVIDAATWTVTHQIPVGNNPHNIWFDLGSQNALVTSWFDTTVSLIDGTSKTETGTYAAGAAPGHVTSDFGGTHWYVTIEGSNYIQTYTQAPGIHGVGGFLPVTPRIPLTGYGPHGIWYGGGLLVVANSMDSTFSIVDPEAGTETALLPTGLLPLGASADAAGLVGAAGNGLGNSVSIYDLPNRRFVRDIPVDGGAIQVPFTPDGSRIVAAHGTSVSVIDAARAVDPVGFPDPASAILATIWTGKGAHGVAFGPRSGGGTYAYVSHKFENYVSVIDLDTLTKAGDIPLLTTTTGKVSLAGATDTGGNGIAVRPNPPPWN